MLDQYHKAGWAQGWMAGKLERLKVVVGDRDFDSMHFRQATGRLKSFFAPPQTQVSKRGFMLSAR